VGAWVSTLTLFGPYRPLFLAAAAVALAFAWRRVYRPAVECAPGEACAVPAVRRGQKLAFWLVAAFVLAAGLSQYAAPLFYWLWQEALVKKRIVPVALAGLLVILAVALASLLLPENKLAVSATAGAGARTVTLEVPNLTCAGCVIAVRHAITRVPGVLDAQVSLASQTATVRYESEKTTLEAITAATRNAGYPSRPMK
jgi:mercuric transport protein